MPTFKRQESEGTIIWSFSCILCDSEMTKHVAMLLSLQIYSWSLGRQHRNKLWHNWIVLRSRKSFCQAYSDCNHVSNEVAGVRTRTEVFQLQKSSNWQCEHCKYSSSGMIVTESLEDMISIYYTMWMRKFAFKSCNMNTKSYLLVRPFIAAINS